jgi:hypothetical protein
MIFHDIGKLLIYLGLFLIIIGLLFYFGGKFLPLGRLPGDFNWETSNISVHFPVVSCILISIILTILANLFLR